MPLADILPARRVGKVLEMQRDALRSLVRIDFEAIIATSRATLHGASHCSSHKTGVKIKRNRLDVQAAQNDSQRWLVR